MKAVIKKESIRIYHPSKRKRPEVIEFDFLGMGYSLDDLMLWVCYHPSRNNWYSVHTKFIYFYNHIRIDKNSVMGREVI